MIPFRIKIIAGVSGGVILLLIGIILFKNHPLQVARLSSSLFGLSASGNQHASEGTPATASQPIGPLTEVYQNKNYHFSLNYPKSFLTAQQNLQGQAGSQILLYAPKMKQGFQITTYPFDEPGLLTKERILQDIPDIKITNETPIAIGNSIPALGFESSDELVGKTYEVWFISKGSVFQIETYQTFKDQLLAILATWKSQP